MIYDWVDDDIFNLNIFNFIIDDDFEVFYFIDIYFDFDGKIVKIDYDKLVIVGLGIVIIFDVESNINIINNFYVVGIVFY